MGRKGEEKPYYKDVSSLQSNYGLKSTVNFQARWNLITVGFSIPI
jgi:hypothetical protein